MQAPLRKHSIEIINYRYLMICLLICKSLNFNILIIINCKLLIINYVSIIFWNELFH